jgi:hypothetical protein
MKLFPAKDAADFSFVKLDRFARLDMEPEKTAISVRGAPFTMVGRPSFVMENRPCLTTGKLVSFVSL